MLINKHTDANKGKIKEYLYLEDIFGFCETFEKVTKNLGFHITFKTNDLQNIIYSSMADDINVTIINLYLYVRNLIPSVETQVMFNEATQNNYKMSFDECIRNDVSYHIHLLNWILVHANMLIVLNI